MDKEKLVNLKSMIASSNLNFLIGSGLSMPYIPILGDIEEKISKAKNEEQIIKQLKKYYEQVIAPNFEILSNNKKIVSLNTVLKDYMAFFSILSNILVKRDNNILGKQVNIFTTNIDLFCEKALEELNVTYNDGFDGKITPIFDLSNFKRTLYKKSLVFSVSSELPMINLLKLHGSVSWGKFEDNITLTNLSQVDDDFLKNEKGNKFIEEYQKLLIVNPTKKKFEETVLDLVYFELLRMYASELERENALLFVMGFSMADEHIRDITIRCANSNPTLQIFIFAYDKNAVDSLKEIISFERIKFNNLLIIEPDSDNHDLSEINSVLQSVMVSED